MSEIAMEKLNVRRLGTIESIGEEVIVFVEVNNCLVDGVQIES